jgi:hypothetical protein
MAGVVATAQDPREDAWVSWVKLVELVEVAERVASEVARKWGLPPTVSTLATALFSAGSGIAGWIVWSSTNGKLIWSIIAGVAVVLSIVSTTLRFPAKAEMYSTAYGKLNSLRKRLYSFQRTTLRRTVPIDDKLQATLEQFDKEWSEIPDLQSDFYNTQDLRKRIQLEVQQEYKNQGWM